MGYPGRNAKKWQTHVPLEQVKFLPIVSPSRNAMCMIVLYIPLETNAWKVTMQDSANSKIKNVLMLVTVYLKIHAEKKRILLTKQCARCQRSRILARDANPNHVPRVCPYLEEKLEMLKQALDLYAWCVIY